MTTRAELLTEEERAALALDTSEAERQETWIALRGRAEEVAIPPERYVAQAWQEVEQLLRARIASPPEARPDALPQTAAQVLCRMAQVGPSTRLTPRLSDMTSKGWSALWVDVAHEARPVGSSTTWCG